MKIFFISCLLLLSAIPLLSQVKYEKEYRIKAEQVPAAAKVFIDKLTFQRPVKWYKEESLTTITYEAKTKEEGQKYSIEFDSTGQIEDIELKINWTSILASARASIEDALSESFERYRLIKIQRQWTGAAEDLVEAVKTKSTGDRLRVRYEIIVKGKSDAGWQWYEITFSDAGTQLSSKRIILRNTDNLEY